MNNDDILMGEQTKKLYRVPVASFKISRELRVETESENVKSDVFGWAGSEAEDNKKWEDEDLFVD